MPSPLPGRTESDLIIVIPPFSPSDSGPPLGPPTLKAHASHAGLNVAAVDLNIRYVGGFPATAAGPGEQMVLGDHSKDRGRIRSAREHFYANVPLPPVSDSRLCGQLDPMVALPHGFAEIDHAVELMTEDPFWCNFLDEHLFGRWT